MRGRRLPRGATTAAALVLTLVIAGCSSPEASIREARDPSGGRSEVLASGFERSELALRSPAAMAAPAPHIADPVDDLLDATLLETSWILEDPPALSEPVGRIRIPKARIDHPVIEGVQPEQLDVSPGRMPRTAMPGQWGNAVIAGHRSTFGAPFYYVHLLEPGDEIFVETGTGTHTYEVVSTEIVLPTGMWTVQHRDGAWLTLVSCHPIGSNAQRIIVFARLVDGPNHDLIHTLYPGPYLPPKDPALQIPVQTLVTMPDLWVG